MKSRVCDCCRNGTGCAICSDTRRQIFIRRECVFGFCHDSILPENRRPSLTGRFCDSRSGGTGRAICCGPRGPFVTCNKANSAGAVSVVAVCCAETGGRALPPDFSTAVPGSAGRVIRSGPGGPSFAITRMLCEFGFCCVTVLRGNGQFVSCSGCAARIIGFGPDRTQLHQKAAGCAPARCP